MMNWKLLVKLLGVTFLTLLLMIPLFMIQYQIALRQEYQESVESEIARTAARPQTLTGPVLVIRYRAQKPPTIEKDAKTGKRTTQHQPPVEHILRLNAKSLNIEGKAKVEPRRRGIYKAHLYHLELALDGNFDLPADLLRIKPEDGKLIDARAVLLLGVDDLRGIGGNPKAKVNDQTRHFAKPRDSALAAVLPGSYLEMDLGEILPGKAHAFKFAFPLQLMGTRTFSIAPTADDNHIHLVSGWADPSFQGSFLPRERSVSPQGFDATWSISGLNLDSTRDDDDVPPETLGVEFMEPVNIYLQSERAVKYGVLFIVLTFAAFFLWEILRRQPLHLAQYLLAGLALTLFFLLLIALSEHIIFLYAYLIAAVACIGLMVFYLSGVLGGRSRALAFGAGLTGLYGALYGILQLEDHALLMGSLLLFVALAAIMIATRRLNWYKLDATGQPAPDPASKT
jgi:inner membrane protein